MHGAFLMHYFNLYIRTFHIIILSTYKNFILLLAYILTYQELKLKAMTVAVLLCIAGAILLSMFPKTGAILLLFTTAILLSRSVKDTDLPETTEDVPNSAYVSKELQEYPAKWFHRAS